MEFQHVLTVYDGTQRSEDVLVATCRLARPRRAQLTILVMRVVRLTQRLPVYAEGADPEVDSLLGRAARLARECGVHAAFAVRYVRSVGPAVVSEARLNSADLVALAVPDLEGVPSEGSGHADAAMVLREVSCAVMLLRPSR